jgi:hypothetical protein
MDKPNLTQDDLLRLWQNIRETAEDLAPSEADIKAAMHADEYKSMREDDIKAAIGLWEEGRHKTADSPRDAAPVGKANGLNLLFEAAAVLRGQAPASPALADWFTGCVQAIAAGSSPDDAFFAKARTIRWEGSDIDTARRDWKVRLACEEQLANGLKLGGLEEASAFKQVAAKLPVSAGTARNCYYNFETVEEIFFDPPQIPPKKDEL